MKTKLNIRLFTIVLAGVMLCLFFGANIKAVSALNGGQNGGGQRDEMISGCAILENSQEGFESGILQRDILQDDAFYKGCFCECNFKDNSLFEDAFYESEDILLLEDFTLLAPTTYKVQAGDSMWKIAVRFEIGLSELIKANPQIKNPALIYVGQILNIPEGAPLKALEDEVFRLVNVERVRNGLQVLKNNWQAARVARIKSQDMINRNYFNHTSPTYGSPFKMLEDYGLRFSAAAENIAKGQRTAQEVVTAWMNSPGHRANILGKSFTELGVGAAKDANGTLTWTQIFLKPA